MPIEYGRCRNCYAPTSWKISTDRYDLCLCKPCYEYFAEFGRHKTVKYCGEHPWKGETWRYVNGADRLAEDLKKLESDGFMENAIKELEEGPQRLEE